MKRGGISATSLCGNQDGAEPWARVTTFGVRDTVRWWGTECGNLSMHSKTVTRSINWLAWSCGLSPSFHPAQRDHLLNSSRKETHGHKQDKCGDHICASSFTVPCSS